MRKKIEVLLNVILILLLPFMFYINIFGILVNISLGDIIFPFLGLFIVARYKQIFEGRKWIYFLYFLGIMLSMILSYISIQKNESIISVPFVTMFIEIVKTAVIGGYFYIGYLFIKDLKRYKLTLYSLSIGSIFVGLFAVGTYIFYLLDKPFFIEKLELGRHGSRVVGTFEDPNLYAFYLIMIFYISLWNSKIVRNKLASLGMILISAFSLILLIMTVSRSGLLALIVSLVFFVVFNARKISKQSITIFLIFTFILLLGIQLDYSLQNGKVVSEVIDRIENTLIQGYEGDRFQLSRAALQMGNDYFLFGVGKGNFPLNSYIYLGEDNINYQQRFIPHNTLLGIYAQQGIIGVSIFLIFPGYLLYKLLKTKRSQNKYVIPLLVGFLTLSFAINIENVRFMWFLFGTLLASCELNIDITISEQEKWWNNREYKLFNYSLLFLIIVLFINISRYFHVNILAYNGKVIERTVRLPEEGIYTVAFDIWTNDTENKVEIYDGDKLLKSIVFKSAKGKVEEQIALSHNVTVKFISNNDGWMKIRNAYISNKKNTIPLYSYPLVPDILISSLNRKNLLVYTKESSLNQEINTLSKNNFESLEISNVTINKYSNLTLLFDIELEYKKEIDFDCNLSLRLKYNSISDLLPYEPQRNIISYNIPVYRKNSERKLGDKYSAKKYQLLSSTDFKLYGQFYDVNNKALYENAFFEIPFGFIEKEQDIINPGKSYWVNLLYRVTEDNKINMSYSGWVETKRYRLEPGEYNITFKAQGSLLDDEYSVIRIRDSYLNEIAVINLDGTNREYSVPYKVTQKEEGISFILDLINFERKDNKDRRVILEDWVKIE